MGKPSPAVKVLVFRPSTSPASPARSHVQLRSTVSSTATPATPPPPAGLFDWARHDVDFAGVLDQPMPTLVACALDRIGQHIENPLQVPKADALEALQLIRAHFRPEVI